MFKKISDYFSGKTAFMKQFEYCTNEDGLERIWDTIQHDYPTIDINKNDNLDIINNFTKIETLRI